MTVGWQEELRGRLKPVGRLAILGIGSPLKSDDGAGMILIEELQRRGLGSEQVLLLAGSSAPENFTGVIREFGPQLLLAIDAAHMGYPPGSIGLIEPGAQQSLDFSTHMLPFSVMLQYLAAEGLPEALLIGIEPLSTEFGFQLSPVVDDAVRELADFLAAELKEK